MTGAGPAASSFHHASPPAPSGSSGAVTPWRRRWSSIARPPPRRRTRHHHAAVVPRVQQLEQRSCIGAEAGAQMEDGQLPPDSSAAVAAGSPWRRRTRPPSRPKRQAVAHHVEVRPRRTAGTDRAPTAGAGGRGGDPGRGLRGRPPGTAPHHPAPRRRWRHRPQRPAPHAVEVAVEPVEAGTPAGGEARSDEGVVGVASQPVPLLESPDDVGGAAGGVGQHRAVGLRALPGHLGQVVTRPPSPGGGR